MKEEGTIRSWIHAGLECKAKASYLGTINGYVRVPEGHPAYGVHYDKIDVALGETYLTYGDSDTEGWIGFDTAHDKDLWSRHAVEDAGLEWTEQHRQSALLAIDSPFAITHWSLDLVVRVTNLLADRIADLSASQCVYDEKESDVS